MNSLKKKSLEKAYSLFFEAGTKSVSARPLREFVDGKVIGIGTAIDEKLRGIGDVRKLLQFQKKQLKGMKIRWEKKPFSRQVTADEQTAVFADDVYLIIGAGKEKVKMYLRFSIVLHYNGSNWKVIHWHGSKPEEVKSELDTFGIEQWKQKTAALQKLVDQRTADLLIKNRELEIEAALEKVRSVAMGMKERQDMLKICTMIAGQLSVLGLKEIRNVQTAIFKVPMGTYMNYEYYAKHDKTFITETEYTNHKVALAFAKKMLKGKGAVSITHIKGKEKVMDWLRYQKGTNVFIDSYLSKATSLSYYWYSLGPVALGISTYQPLTNEALQLFQRFMKVFELAYQRYLDIEKAEAQTREAQIEAALERVRAKSMAMQESSEIGKLILHVYTELIRLDARLDRCFFMIVNPENLGISWWMASQEGLLAENGFFVQYNEHPSHLLYLHHWKNRSKKWHYLFEGKEKRDWDRFGFAKTELSRLPDPVKKFMSAAKAVHLSGSSDAFGSLVTGSFEPLSDEHQDIISRFASVFNQTYTRFNDLKKAEAQAREAQIEAALERIRSRTVGMQRSEELKEVIQVVYEQFIRLNIHTEHAGFIMDYKERDDFQTWIADQFGSPSQVTLPYFDCIYYNRFNEAKKKGVEFFSVILNRQEKNKFYKGLFKYIPGFPEASKKIILSHSGFSISTVLLENLALYIENFTGTPFSDEDNAILIRFGKVFQQTYTRFLDLQKAEEQAREAEIQLALERVRARSLAMHRTEELQEVVNVVAQQLLQMGIDMNGGMFIAINEELGRDFPFWAAAGAADYIQKVKIPFLDLPIFTNLTAAIRTRIPFFTEFYTQEEKNQFMQHMFRHEPWKQNSAKRKKELLERAGGYARSVCINRYTCIGITNHHGKRFSVEENKILQRFGNVLEQSYTRFLDLQKAEAQAKESQIQLALERVRARTMAMQQSNELPDAANLLFQQVQALGMPAWSAGYCIWEEDKKAVTLWMSSEGVLQPPFKAPTTEDELFIQMREGHEKGKDLHVVEMGGKKLQAHYQYMRTLPVVGEIFDSILAAGHQLPAYQVMHYAYFSKGYLLFITYEPVPEVHEIFKRFANVFDQTYTRFLDLEKSEAQAREAGIQLALERVRARTMAMYHSEELADVVSMLYRQFEELGFGLYQILISIFDTANNNIEWWSRGFGESSLPQCNIIPIVQHPLPDLQLKNWKSGKTFHAYVFGGADKRSWENYLFTGTDLKHFPEEVKEQMKSIGTVYLSDAFMKYGVLQAAGPEPLPADKAEILMRFAKVLDQAYTRMMDLQKAEAQAKEAQIEAALERVRSRTMAMHTSDELLGASEILFSEMQKLGIESLTAGYVLMDEEGRNGLNYTPDPFTKKILPLPVIIPHDETIHMQRVVENWKKGSSCYIVEMDEEETIRHQTFIAERSTNFTLTAAELIAISPSRLFLHNFYFKDGYLLIVGGNRLSAEQTDIMLRFAKVFQQTYTRFLDLQKAEAQAKEAKIESALERVRSRSLAMHHSSELSAVVDTLLREFTSLEFSLTFCIINLINEQDKSNTVWAANPETGMAPESYYMKFEDYPFHHAMWDAWKAQKKRFIYTLEGEEKTIYDEYLYNRTEFRRFPSHVQEANKALKRYVAGFTFFKYSGLQTVSENQITTEDLDILERFGRVFEQSYTRFLDLQKAEAQAREAQIEAALERVRSRSMAMHRSEELSDLSLELVKQVQALGVATWFCAFNIYDDDAHSSLEWGSNGQGVFSKYRTPREGIFLRYYQAGQSGETLLVNEIGEAECPAHYEYLCSLPGVGDQLRQMKSSGIPFPTSQIDHVAFFKHGYIIFITYEPVPETHDIFKRFARVFEQSYTRFLDLQKAEAQAREAQIEVAVERVRAKALAMHRSEEILQVAMTLKEQMDGLELKGVTAATIYLQQNDGRIRAWDITEWKESENGPQLTVDFTFSLEDTDPGLWVRRIWSTKEKYSVVEMSGDDFVICEKWLRGFDETMADNYLKFIEAADLKHSWHPTVPLEQGKLNIDFILPPPAEMEFILPKMGAAFDLAYRRFLDLQKAEAQAREALIETALERVRARALAMHSSREFMEVAKVLREQMGALGQRELETSAVHLYEEDPDYILSWRAFRLSTDMESDITYGFFKLPKDSCEIAREFSRRFKSEATDYTIEVSGARQEEWYAILFQLAPEVRDAMIKTGTTKEIRYYHLSKFSGGALLMVSSKLPVSETIELQKRAAQVFDLAYRRFRDLQKAEEQARESQIQLALERVRARTMAMHKSDELPETSHILFEQMKELGEPVEQLTIGIVNEENKVVEISATLLGGTLRKIYSHSIEEPYMMAKVYKAWKEQQKTLVVALRGDELNAYNHYRNELTHSNMFLTNHGKEDQRIVYAAFFSKGMLALGANEIRPPESLQLLAKFASVFDLTYRRFLDLQKAEAQTKEAQIETALEKIRSRTMAMQNSNELQETAALLFQEFRKLGAEDIYQVTIGIYDEASQLIDFRVTSWAGSGEQESRAFQLDMNEPTVLQPAVSAWKNHQKSVVIDLTGEALEGWLNYRNKMSGISVSSADTGGRRVISAAFYSKGHLSISTKEPVSPDTIRILERFAAVFDTTYTRFQDLQKAEAQAKEARIEAALERVRSRTLAMQKSDELAETAAVLFHQLITLGIEPNRLYIILIKENNAEMEAWVTDEDGSRVSMGFTGNYNHNGSLYKMYEGWKEKRTSLVIDMQGEELQQYFHYLHDELQVPFKGGLEQKRRVQHIVYFSHGLIGMASPEEQPIETLQLMERFAAVFNLTFTRFNDLKIAEAHAAQAEQDLIAIKEAKQKAEEAFTELQATQKQLIQSEKMASLGELTAGIAHEIQNPLNFVNNFSEVSKELLDEIRMELEKGNLDDAKEIMQDVIQNLEKIHHHGKRADGIVKGMLQHSRTGSGQMEATDINALCDEYLRLSYHGLRAKDKSFNARFETHFDPSVGKVSVLPQDLGRVILNLINNAFYAVAERKKSGEAGYEPTVIIRTSRSSLPEKGGGGEVSISVKDNGAGIPKSILDKIFQPFFTTKPTGQGTGLGLSLSYDIVKAHGGELKVETKEGEGTEFIIVLPIARITD